MSLTFPLAISDFADQIHVSSVKWSLKDNRQQDTLASGDILEQDLAPQLWTGDVTLAEIYHYEAKKIEALINAVIRSMGTVYLYDPRTPGPYADQDGSILGASNVTIAATAGQNLIALTGLPAGYVLTPGDYLAYDYGGPARRAFLQLATGFTADPNGLTAGMEVAPFLPIATAAGAAVTLFKPAMKCGIVPGSFSGGQSTQNTVTTQLSFSVIQKP